MEKDYDSDTPRDKDQQGNRKLNVAGDRNTGISIQKRSSKWTGCDAREHREPAIRDGQRPFIDEEHQTANARDKRPRPGHDPNNHQANCPHMANHSYA
jgi:hypothetical protein